MNVFYLNKSKMICTFYNLLDNVLGSTFENRTYTFFAN